MVEDGVMADIDIIIALHVGTALATGQVGVCPGFAQAASRDLKLTFLGQPSHTSQPHMGADALAMAVKTYNEIQFAAKPGD